MPDLLNTLQGLQGIGGQASNLLNTFSPGQENPYMKSPSLAANVFGLSGETFTNSVPFLGFQYYVKIYYDANAKDHLTKYFGADLGNFTDIMPMIKNVSLPSVGIDTDILNEYNRHRINQQRVNFEPAKLTFHDVANGNTMKLWQAYYNYYFADGVDPTTAKRIGKTNNPLETDSGTGQPRFGYNLKNVKRTKYLFRQIEIYQVQGTRVNRTTLYNPRISSFDHDTLSYESSTPVELSMTFEYEWINYDIGTLIMGEVGPPNFTTGVGPDEPIHTDVTEFFSAELSNSFELRAFKNLSSQIDLTTRTVDATAQIAGTGGIAGVGAANKQSPLDTLRNIKKQAQGIVGRAASASALFNQIQIDVLGVDEPIINAPHIRDFSAIINSVPTSYPDVRRVVRNLSN